MRYSRRLLSLSSLSALFVLVALPAQAGLVITPVYDSSIANDPHAGAIEADINSMLSLYQANFADNINVKVYFQKGGGLGSSEWGYYYNGAGTAIQALTADAKTADDAVAVSHLNTNVFGSVAYTSANGRALGLNTPGFLTAGGVGGFDGVISLNTDVCFLDHNAPQSGLFDLYSAAAHELDEVLGTSSGASGALALTADLFRYDGSGNRSFSGDTSQHAYFSLDGKNLIDEYNQYGRGDGDWGDWVAHGPSQTQDWVVGDGQKIDPGEPEFRLLDAVGYDRIHPQATPEPTVFLSLGLGVVAMIRRRKRV